MKGFTAMCRLFKVLVTQHSQKFRLALRSHFSGTGHRSKTTLSQMDSKHMKLVETKFRDVVLMVAWLVVLQTKCSMLDLEGHNRDVLPWIVIGSSQHY